MLIKLIFETPVKGGKTRVSCINSTPSAVRKCNEHYVQSRGTAVIKNYPIAKKIEYIFDDSDDQIQTINVLEHEGG